MKRDTIVFTGATSQLTQFFIKFLQEKYPNKFDIITSVRKIEDLHNFNYFFDKTNISFHVYQTYNTYRLILDYKPNYFFNFAAITRIKGYSVDDYIKANYQPVIDHLQTIIKYSPHTKYINAGSSAEFYENNHYGFYKKLTKKYIQKIREDFNIFAIQPTIFNFTSHLQSSDFIFMKLIREGSRIKNELYTTGDVKEKIKLGNVNYNKWFCHVDDVVDGIWKLSNQEDYLFRSFLIDGILQGDKTTIQSLSREIFKQLGICGDFVEIDEKLKRDEINSDIEYLRPQNWNYSSIEEIVKKILTKI